MIEYESEIIRDFKEDLVDSLISAGYKQVNACIQCGTCSGGCPSGKRTALKVRTIIRKVQLGIDEVLSDNDIWYCSTCYTCLERCPRKLPITDMIIYLRNLAVRKGFILESHLDLCKKFFSSGHGVPIDEEKWKKLREAYGLNQIPPTVHSDQKALEEVQQLLKSARFDKLVNLDIKRTNNEEEKPTINRTMTGLNRKEKEEEKYYVTNTMSVIYKERKEEEKYYITNTMSGLDENGGK